MFEVKLTISNRKFGRNGSFSRSSVDFRGPSLTSHLRKAIVPKNRICTTSHRDLGGWREIESRGGHVMAARVVRLHCS
eukprot:2017420-Rhodomonas_salina.3